MIKKLVSKLLSSEEQKYRFNKNIEIYCWKTKFQTPYDIKLQPDIVKNLFIDDINKDKLGDLIKVKYILRTLDNIRKIDNMKGFEKVWNKENDNFIFKYDFKINAIKNFWQVIIFTKDFIELHNSLILI